MTAPSGRAAQTAEREEALASVDALVALKTEEAAGELADIARTSADKQVQKAARRGLHRLSSQGIHAPAVEPPAPATIGTRAATVYRAIASAFDGTGTRALWFAAERPLGDIYMVVLGVNDLAGLNECSGHDTTRKRFAEREAELRKTDPMSWVELPVEYARQLVQEAVENARESGAVLPVSYPSWAHLIDSPEEPFHEALVYKEISAFEVRMHPTLQNEGELLFEQSEAEPWFFLPNEVEKWVRQLAEPAGTRLVLTPESEDSRLERLIREAVKELFTPRVKKAYKRRLEETAYIFLRTGRHPEARRAVAAAITIEDERPLQPPHPFLRTLVARSMRIALSVRRSGQEPFRLAKAPQS